jgi:uncharacterized membrane protein YhaH (DUF805 family)
MSFVDAVKSGLRNYAVFKGRAGRGEYWWFVLFGVIVQAAVGSFGEGLGNFVSVALVLPSIAVGVRRMHDIGKRGWWLIIPIYNIVLLARAGDPTLNSFGPPPLPSSTPSAPPSAPLAGMN